MAARLVEFGQRILLLYGGVRTRHPGRDWTPAFAGVTEVSNPMRARARGRFQGAALGPGLERGRALRWVAGDGASPKGRLRA